ncbi:hypothetical protein GGH99_000641 [Coemansia sp. RSA 1285]|nr:hypothetical protein GGH99_000641 [Coemansia sp. RSA 1285]
MVRKRNHTYSFSSSALDEVVARRTRASSTSSLATSRSGGSARSDGSVLSSRSGRVSCASSITSVPDSICSVDTFPKLSNSGPHASVGSGGKRGGGMMAAAANSTSGPTTPLSATRAALRHGLGRLRRRFPLSAGAAEHRASRKRRGVKYAPSIATIDSSSGRAASKRRRRLAASGGAEQYRLPRSLRPSSMFHIRVRYAHNSSRKSRGISSRDGSGGSSDHQNNSGNNDEPYKRLNNPHNRSIVIIAPLPDPQDSSSIDQKALQDNGKASQQQSKKQQAAQGAMANSTRNKAGVTLDGAAVIMSRRAMDMDRVVPYSAPPASGATQAVVRWPQQKQKQQQPKQQQQRQWSGGNVGAGGSKGAGLFESSAAAAEAVGGSRNAVVQRPYAAGGRPIFHYSQGTTQPQPLVVSGARTATDSAAAPRTISPQPLLAQQPAAFHPFSFSPSISSLLSVLSSAELQELQHRQQLMQQTINNTLCHPNSLPHPIADLPNTAPAQMETTADHAASRHTPNAAGSSTSLHRSNTRLVDDRLSLILACRYCAAVHQPGNPKTVVTVPCAQCLADPTMVLPRRANFVHTSAGPTLDIVEYFAAHYARASAALTQQALAAASGNHHRHHHSHLDGGALGTMVATSNNSNGQLTANKSSFDSAMQLSTGSRSSNGSDNSLGSLGNLLASVVSSAATSSSLNGAGGKQIQQGLNGSGVWYDSDDAPADSLPGMRIRLRQRSVAVPRAPSTKSTGDDDGNDDDQPAKERNTASAASGEGKGKSSQPVTVKPDSSRAEPSDAARISCASDDSRNTDMSQYHSVCSADEERRSEEKNIEEEENDTDSAHKVLSLPSSVPAESQKSGGVQQNSINADASQLHRLFEHHVPPATNGPGYLRISSYTAESKDNSTSTNNQSLLLLSSPVSPSSAAATTDHSNQREVTTAIETTRSNSSTATTTATRSRGASNHLLLSGIETEFVPELVFKHHNHNRQSVPDDLLLSGERQEQKEHADHRPNTSSSSFSSYSSSGSANYQTSREFADDYYEEIGYHSTRISAQSNNGISFQPSLADALSRAYSTRHRTDSIYSSLPPSPTDIYMADKNINNKGGSTTAGTSTEDMAGIAKDDTDDQILLHRLSVDPIPWDIQGRPRTAPGPRETGMRYGGPPLGGAWNSNMYSAAKGAGDCECSCTCVACLCGCNRKENDIKLVGGGWMRRPDPTVSSGVPWLPPMPAHPQNIVGTEQAGRSPAWPSPQPSSSAYCSCTGNVSSLASFSPSLRPATTATTTTTTSISVLGSMLTPVAKPLDIVAKAMKHGTVDGRRREDGEEMDAVPKLSTSMQSDAMSFRTALSSIDSRPSSPVANEMQRSIKPKHGTSAADVVVGGGGVDRQSPGLASLLASAPPLPPAPLLHAQRPKSSSSSSNGSSSNILADEKDALKTAVEERGQGSQRLSLDKSQTKQKTQPDDTHRESLPGPPAAHRRVSAPPVRKQQTLQPTGRQSMPPPLLPLQRPRHRRHSAIDRGTGGRMPRTRGVAAELGKRGKTMKRLDEYAADEDNGDGENEEDLEAPVVSLTASAPSLFPARGNLMQTLFPETEEMEESKGGLDIRTQSNIDVGRGGLSAHAVRGGGGTYSAAETKANGKSAAEQQKQQPSVKAANVPDKVISPLSERSVPVVTQAHRARHPVYKFGAYANDTFTSGKHQEAFELYSWALMLLNPPEGTTPMQMLNRSQAQKQLQRLGWNHSTDTVPTIIEPSSPNPGVLEAKSPPPHSTSLGNNGAGPGKSVVQTQQSRSSAWHTKLSSIGRSIGSGRDGGGGGGGAAALAADAASKPSAQQLNDKEDPNGGAAQSGTSSGRRLWLSLTQSSRRKPSGKMNQQSSHVSEENAAQGTGNAIVIDEPLPEELAQTPSGRFEFSKTLLRQLHAVSAQNQDQNQDQEQQQNQQEARESQESQAAVPADDPWWMAEGDEKTDICALLYSNRAAAAHALGKYSAAISDASKSIDLRPDWAKAYFRKAEALLALARVRESYSYYKRAAALEPNDIHVRVSCERARIMAQNEELGLSVVQLLAGRDFALKPKGLHPIRSRIFEFAAGMQNYVYLIADTDTRKCIVVDACWDIDGILAVIEREKLLLAAAAVTHGHFDHTGGIPPAPFSSLRIKVGGVSELKRRMPHLPLLVHPLDVPEIIGANPQLKPHHFTPTPNGFNFRLGSRTQIQFLHTPGHTPGSQCLFVNECRLFSGDTLFPGSCGRVDLKGGCVEDMIESLQTRLCAIPDQTIVYPGHEYGGEWTSIGREKKRGFLKPVGPEGSAEEKWSRLDRCRHQDHHRKKTTGD